MCMFFYIIAANHINDRQQNDPVLLAVILAPRLYNAPSLLDSAYGTCNQKADWTGSGYPLLKSVAPVQIADQVRVQLTTVLGNTDEAVRCTAAHFLQAPPFFLNT